MLTVKEMLRTEEIRQILIDEFYSNAVDFMTLYSGETPKELTLDDRLDNLYEELSKIIDSRIKAIPQLSGEEFFHLLHQKQALLNNFNRHYYKNTLANNYPFEELGAQIVDDIVG